MNRMKGDSTCHIPNDKYRGNYDNTFREGSKRPMERISPGVDGTTPDEEEQFDVEKDRGFWP